MPHTYINHPSKKTLGLIAAVTSMVVTAGVILNAEVLFTRGSQAEEGMLLRAGNDTIFFCAMKPGSPTTFPLMTSEMRTDTSIHFVVSEYSGQSSTQRLRSYDSDSESNTLTEFQRGKLYVMHTDADIFFKCNSGLSRSASDAAQNASTPFIPADSSASSASSQQGSSASPFQCPIMQCAAPVIPNGCLFVQDRQANGCLGCGQVICTSSASSRQGSATSDIYDPFDPTVASSASSTIFYPASSEESSQWSDPSCPAIQCSNDEPPEGCFKFSFSFMQTCPVCPKIVCPSSSAASSSSIACGTRCMGDVCVNTCTQYCGNGMRDPWLNEECDDGNTVNTDYCMNDCKANPSIVCGDHIIGAAEECDDGNQNNTDACTNTCTINNNPQAYCGDYKKEGAEECDDGNHLDTDLCTSDCTIVPSAQNGKLLLTVNKLPDFTAFNGQKNLPVLNFTAKAAAGDVDIHSFAFRIDTGYESKTTFTLWEDTNGDGTVDALVGPLVQTNFIYTIQNTDASIEHLNEGASSVFEVHADINSGVSYLAGLKVRFNPESGAYNDLINYPLVRASVGGTPLRGIKINTPCTTFCGIGLTAADTQYTNVKIYRSGTLFIRPDPGNYAQAQQLKTGQAGNSALYLELEARLEDMSLDQIQFKVPALAGRSVDHLEIYEHNATTALATATRENCINNYAYMQNTSVFCANMPHGTLVVPAGQTKLIHVRPVVATLENGAIINSKFAVSLHVDPHSIVDDGYDLKTYSIGALANGFSTCDSLACATGMTTNQQVKYTDRNDKTYYQQDFTPPSDLVITTDPKTQKLWRQLFSITGPLNTVAPDNSSVPVQTEENQTKDKSIGLGVYGMTAPKCLTSDCRRVLVPVSMYVKGFNAFYDFHISANVDPLWTSVSFKGEKCTKNTSYPHYDGLDIYDCPIATINSTTPVTQGVGMVLETATPCPLPAAYKNVIVSFSPGSWDQIYNPTVRMTPALPAPCGGQQ